MTREDFKERCDSIDDDWSWTGKEYAQLQATLLCAELLFELVEVAKKEGGR